MEIGTVISTPDSPNPAKVSFVVDSSEPVHRGQFVEMEYSEKSSKTTYSRIRSARRSICVPEKSTGS